MISRIRNRHGCLTHGLDMCELIEVHGPEAHVWHADSAGLDLCLALRRWLSSDLCGPVEHVFDMLVKAILSGVYFHHVRPASYGFEQVAVQGMWGECRDGECREH